MYRLHSFHPRALMNMPGAPKLILAVFLPWPYDPEESQEPPPPHTHTRCLHTEPESWEISALSSGIIAALVYHLQRLGSKNASEVY